MSNKTKSIKKSLKNHNPKNKKRAADWTKRKGCSVVKYDPEYDINFHDIDKEKVQKWIDAHNQEYVESKELIEKIKNLLPREEYTYGHKDKVNEQKCRNDGFRLLYDFHKVANLRYMSKYGDDETELAKQYKELRKEAEKFIKDNEKGESKGVLDILDGIDFSDIVCDINKEM